MIYAFLLINLRNFSKHQKKHLQQHRMALVTSLSYFLSFWSTYSSAIRIMRQTVMMNDPKARVPIWYLKVCPEASITAKKGKFDLFQVQYQVAKTDARII